MSGQESIAPRASSLGLWKCAIAAFVLAALVFFVPWQSLVSLEKLGQSLFSALGTALSAVLVGLVTLFSIGASVLGRPGLFLLLVALGLGWATLADKKVISERLFSMVMPLLMLAVLYSLLMIIPLGGRVVEFFDGPQASSKTSSVIDTLTAQEFEKIKQGYELTYQNNVVAQQVLGEKAREWDWWDWSKFNQAFMGTELSSTTLGMQQDPQPLLEQRSPRSVCPGNQWSDCHALCQCLWGNENQHRSTNLPC